MRRPLPNEPEGRFTSRPYDAMHSNAMRQCCSGENRSLCDAIKKDDACLRPYCENRDSFLTFSLQPTVYSLSPSIIRQLSEVHP
jgi:hypothetical protein